MAISTNSILGKIVNDFPQIALQNPNFVKNSLESLKEGNEVAYRQLLQLIIDREATKKYKVPVFSERSKAYSITYSGVDYNTPTIQEFYKQIQENWQEISNAWKKACDTIKPKSFWDRFK